MRCSRPSTCSGVILKALSSPTDPGLVNAGKREKSERGEKRKGCQREGEEEAGVARKSTEQGKRHRRIESVGQARIGRQRACLDEEKRSSFQEQGLSGLWNKEPRESSFRMGRQGSPGGSNLRRAVPMNKGHDQIAQGSQDLGSMARAKAGAIFKKGDITHVMRPVFNAPMSPNQFKQALGTSLLTRKGGNDVNDLKAGLASLFGGDRAGKSSHLGHSKPILLQIARKR